MPVTLELANDVLRCRREGLTVQETARQIRRSVEEVREAVRMLGSSMLDDGDDPTPPARPSAAERERALDRLPKKMAERIRKAEQKGRGETDER